MHVLGNSAVHAHYFFVDEGHEGHVVEAVVEGLPETDLVSTFDFVEETVYARDGLTLVVASEDDHLMREADFEGQEQADDLATLLATVDVVSHEEVPALLRNNIVTLISLVLVTHLLEHVQEI